MRYVTVLIAILFTTFPTFAQNHGLGLGVSIGQPDGIAGKYWLTQRHAVDFGLGMDIGPTTTKANGDKENAGSRIYLHGDYLLHSLDAIQSSEQFPIYIGVGGYLETGAGGEDMVGVRGVGGLMYWVRQAPLDLFLEVAPTLQVTPSVGFGFETSIGVRYYFAK